MVLQKYILQNYISTLEVQMLKLIIQCFF